MSCSYYYFRIKDEEHLVTLEEKNQIDRLMDEHKELFRFMWELLHKFYYLEGVEKLKAYVEEKQCQKDF